MLRRGALLGLVLLLSMAFSAPWAISEQALPAYHANPPAPGARLPKILGKDQLQGTNDQYPFQAHAYELAAKIQRLLYQQPCYCYCDRTGHKSLRSCFEGTHGAECSTCLKELYYTYLMTKQHKTAAQIRRDIIAGEWQQVDLQSAATIN